MYHNGGRERTAVVGIYVVLYVDIFDQRRVSCTRGGGRGGGGGVDTFWGRFRWF